MSHMIDISFVIPVFNKAHVLPYVLTALKNQVGHFTAEYIFVDDNSSDDSISVIMHESKRLKLRNVQVIENAESKGMAVRVNQGISKALGDFLFFMDAGDILSINAVHNMYERMIISGADMARGQFEVSIKKPEQLVNLELPSPVPAFISTHPLGTLLIQRTIQRLGIMARHETVIKSGGADTSLYMDDISLTLNLAQASSKMIAIVAPIFRVAKQFNLFRHDPRNQFQIWHDVFLSYYRFILFMGPSPDEYDLALNHAMDCGLEYVKRSTKQSHNFVAYHKFKTLVVIAKSVPFMRLFVVRQLANYIKRDTKRWKRRVDVGQIKIIPVYEDDIPPIKLYFTQSAKDIDFLSARENWRQEPDEAIKSHLAAGSDSVFLKAVYKNEIVGLCLLKRYDISNTYYLSATVMPTYWDNGIGSLLIKTALKIARQRSIKHIVIHVDTKDKRALSFLQKHGFKRQESVKESIAEGNKVFKSFVLQLEL